MAEKPKPVDAMPILHKEVQKLSASNRLTAASKNVDELIQLLTEAREKIAAAPDPHNTSMRVTMLQNPVKDRFEKVNESLSKVSKVQKQLGKALDRALPVTDIPTEHDAMEGEAALINRAIAMHLLREGQFSVASTFIAEASNITPSLRPRLDVYGDEGGGTVKQEEEEADDQDMDTDVGTESEQGTSNRSRGGAGGDGLDEDQDMDTPILAHDLPSKFAEMYRILQALKQEDLGPAISWARAYSTELDERGSNLEFELSKLQYVHLFLGSGNVPAGSVGTGPTAAFLYAKDHMQRFWGRHLKELQQLAAALVFASNLADSPYAALFDSTTAFTDVAASFTREFCSLLGLSAESPLYVAATAGAVALPRLVKYMKATRLHGAEWTTQNELAFETPLPRSFMYHSVFVCPVSKEQTTVANPPMILPCGHVLARESLHNIAKGPRFKCPYCPYEGQVKDTRVVIL